MGMQSFIFNHLMEFMMGCLGQDDAKREAEQGSE